MPIVLTTRHLKSPAVFAACPDLGCALPPFLSISGEMPATVCAPGSAWTALRTAERCGRAWGQEKERLGWDTGRTDSLAAFAAR